MENDKDLKKETENVEEQEASRQEEQENDIASEEDIDKAVAIVDEALTAFE